MAATVVTVAVVVPQRQPRQLLVHRSCVAGERRFPARKDVKSGGHAPTLSALSHARCTALIARRKQNCGIDVYEVGPVELASCHDAALGAGTVPRPG